MLRNIHMAPLPKENIEKALRSTGYRGYDSTSQTRYREALEHYEEHGGEKPVNPDAWQHPDPKPTTTSNNNGWG